MPTITFTLSDGYPSLTGAKRIGFRARQTFADGDTTVYPRTWWKTYPHNTEQSVTLLEGQWEVYGLTTKSVPFDVPAGGGDLWELIAANLEIPATTPAQRIVSAVESWMSANVNTEVTDTLMTGLLSDPESEASQAVDARVAAGTTGFLTEEDADANYAPVPKDTNDDVLAVQPTLGWVSVMDYGAKRADVIVDASVSAAGTTVTSASGKFTPAMNGRKFYFHGAGPVLVSGTNAWQAHPLVGTFTYVSATQGTLSTAATTAVTNGRIVIGEDTTARVQAALDSGASRVHLPPNSSFIVNELRIPDYVELTGSNRFTSRLYSTTPKANVVASILTTEPAVSNLSIWGNGWGSQPPNTFPGEGVAPNLANSGCGLIFAHCTRATAQDVLVFFAGGDGVTTDRNGIAGIYLTFGCSDSNVTRCRTLYCRNGINEDAFFNGANTAYQAYCSPIDNTYDANITNFCRFGLAIDSGSLSRGASITNHVSRFNVIYGIDVHASKYVSIVNPRCSYNGANYTAPGIQVYGDSSTVTCEHITIIGPQCFANGTHGIRISEYVKDWKIIGGMCARNFRHGIYINSQANDGFIVGTSTRRNGQGTDSPGSYDGVRVTSSQRVHVMVNSFDDAADYSETATQAWGVRVDGTSDNITIDDACKFRGNTAGEVSLTGTNSRRGAKAVSRVLAAAQGFVRETVRRALCNTTANPGAGTIRGTALSLQAGDVVSGLRFVATVAPSGLTLVKAALVDAGGTVLAVSANLSSTLTAVGEWSLPLSAAYTAAADMVVYPVLLQVGTTPATMLCSTTNMSPTAVASGPKEAVSVASQTDITAGATLTLSGSGTALWAAAA